MVTERRAWRGKRLLGVALVMLSAPGVALSQGLFDIPEAQELPVREGTYDIDRNQPPDYWNAWLDRFSKRASGLWGKGYPKPDKTNLYNYSSFTLQYLEQRVSQMPDPCEQAVFTKLFLDASQDDFVPVDFFNTPKEKFAEVGLDIMLTIYVPNVFDLSKGAKDLVFDPAKGLSELKVASKLLNAVSIAQALSKLATGTHDGQMGRWRFGIYEKSRKEGWSPERIETERRQRHEENGRLLEEVQALGAEMEQKVAEREALYQQRMARIEADLQLSLKEIDADQAVDGETRRRLAQLQTPGFVVPGTESYRPGEVIADRTPMEEMRQRYLADAANQYDRARNGARIEASARRAAEELSRERDVRMTGKDYNEKIALRLGELARINAENDSLKNYAGPMAAGDCEKLRKPPGGEDKAHQGGFVTSHHSQRDWYCTNRPVIETPVRLPPILEKK